MREAFEEWAINHCIYDLRKTDCMKVYTSMTTRRMWLVWQAAWEASRNDNH